MTLEGAADKIWRLGIGSSCEKLDQDGVHGHDHEMLASGESTESSGTNPEAKLCVTAPCFHENSPLGCCAKATGLRIMYKFQTLTSLIEESHLKVSCLYV